MFRTALLLLPISILPMHMAGKLSTSILTTSEDSQHEHPAPSRQAVDLFPKHQQRTEGLLKVHVATVMFMHAHLEGRKEGSVPCPGQPELAYKGKSSALVTGFVLAEGTHQTRCLFWQFYSI